MLHYGPLKADTEAELVGLGSWLSSDASDVGGLTQVLVAGSCSLGSSCQSPAWCAPLLSRLSAASLLPLQQRF